MTIYYFDENFEGVEGYTKPGWYFWDETEASVVGPFENSDNAQIALNVYAVAINEQ